MAADGRAGFEADARLFGRLFEQQRGILDLSREAVAEATGLSADYIGRIGCGTVNPTLEEMAGLAEAVGVQVWDLLRPL